MYVFLYVILKESVRVSSACLCVACSSSFSLLLLSSLSGVKWLKNDLKTSPPKVFFFEDFLNFSTSRHSSFFRRFLHTLENNTRKHSEKKRERKRDQVESRLVSVVFMVVLVEE